MFYWRIYSVGVLSVFLSALLLIALGWISQIGLSHELDTKLDVKEALAAVTFGTAMLVFFGSFFCIGLTVLWNYFANRLSRTMPFAVAAVKTSGAMSFVLTVGASLWLFVVSDYQLQVAAIGIGWGLGTVAIAMWLTRFMFVEDESHSG